MPEIESSVAGSRHDVVTQVIDSGAIVLKPLTVLALLLLSACCPQLNPRRSRISRVDQFMGLLCRQDPLVISTDLNRPWLLISNGQSMM